MNEIYVIGMKIPRKKCWRGGITHEFLSCLVFFFRGCKHYCCGMLPLRYPHRGRSNTALNRVERWWTVARNAIPLRILPSKKGNKNAKKRMKLQMKWYIKILDEHALGVTMQMAYPSISLIPWKIHFGNFMESWNPGRKDFKPFS